MLRSKFFFILIHIGCWLLFLCPPLLFFNRVESASAWEILRSWEYFQFAFLFIFIFYLNAYVLIPHIFFTKKYFLYFLTIIVLLAPILILRPVDTLMFSRMRAMDKNRGFPTNSGHFHRDSDRFKPNSLPHEPKRDRNNMQGIEHRRPPGPMGLNPQFGRPLDLSSIFIFLIIIAIGLAYKLIIQWQYSEKRALSAEAEKANAELSFLKAQINPHFLFNTLNNIYSLAVSGNKQTADSIMKLSNIMHFITDEANVDFISLRREIDFIQDYIALQSLRLGKGTKVIFDVEGEIDYQQVPPLIFISFIENAFKYGVSKNQDSEIFIKIIVDHDVISFRTINHNFKNNNIIERTGIGISNSKKRLQYLYPNRHKLSIREVDNLFLVHLTLYCNS